MPQTLGKAKALTVSRVSHLLAALTLGGGFYLLNAGPIALAGVGFAALMLIWEQSLVKPDDLSKVNMAFFTLNGFVSIGIFAFVLADVIF